MSIAVLLASYKVQDRVQAKTMTVKMTCAGGIQEYIETIRDLNQGCDIVFDHVGFAYNSGETVLKDVSFTAKQGEVTALVGPSGGGKTTVSRLAARFWDHEKGSITVSGMDISKVDPEKLMGLYSIVFQDVTLFDNSILENIVRTRPMRKCLKRRDSRTVTSLPRSCPTAGTPTSARTAARSPAASVSAFLLRARF